MTSSARPKRQPRQAPSGPPDPSRVQRYARVFFVSLLMVVAGAGGVGLGLVPLGLNLWRAFEVSRWQPVSARVLETRIDVRTDSDGDETYQVRATYTYQANGREQVASRIGLVDTGADNIGGWHHEWHARLEDARQRSQPVAAWFDPAHPERALLDRRLRPGMVAFHAGFAVVFIGVAVGAAWMLWQGDRGAPVGTGGRVPLSADLLPSVRGRLDTPDGQVLFVRHWPRFTALGLVVPLLILLAAGAGASGWPSRVAVGLGVTAGLALIVHLGTLRWRWLRLPEGLQVERRSWLQQRRWTLTHADVATVDQVVVYTSSTNGGPTVRHPRLVARRGDGTRVALTPALADPRAADLVQKHLQQTLPPAPKAPR